MEVIQNWWLMLNLLFLRLIPTCYFNRTIRVFSICKSSAVHRFEIHFIIADLLTFILLLRYICKRKLLYSPWLCIFISFHLENFDYYTLLANWWFFYYPTITICLIALGLKPINCCQQILLFKSTRKSSKFKLYYTSLESYISRSLHWAIQWTITSKVRCYFLGIFSIYL